MLKPICFLLLLLSFPLTAQPTLQPTELDFSIINYRQEYLACATEQVDLVHTPKGTYLLNERLFSGCARQEFQSHKQYRVSYITRGVVEKEVSYYDSGNTHAVFNFKDGRPHGYHFMYYPDGSKYTEEFYVNGVKEGYHRRWLKNGQLAREERFSGGGLRPW